MPGLPFSRSAMIRMFAKNKTKLSGLNKLSWVADSTISIDAMLQKEPADGETQTDIIILTHQAQEKQVDRAIAAIEALSTVADKVTRIRLENLA